MCRGSETSHIELVEVKHNVCVQMVVQRLCFEDKDKTCDFRDKSHTVFNGDVVILESWTAFVFMA